MSTGLKWGYKCEVMKGGGCGGKRQATRYMYYVGDIYMGEAVGEGGERERGGGGGEEKARQWAQA